MLLARIPVRLTLVLGAAACVSALMVLPADRARASHVQSPPPVTMKSRAGLQRAAQESFCVFVPPHDGEAYGIFRCVDTVDLPPRRLSVVRPGGVVTIRFHGATSLRDGIALVRVLGRKRYFYSFRIHEPTKRWRVKLRPRAYEIEVFGRFEMADGRRGDTFVSLGLLVDRRRKPSLVPLTAVRPPSPPVAG